jgi:drug/metabolite transporter (DMT)-like permease
MIGALFFGTNISWRKGIGVLMGFGGLCLLFISKGQVGLHYLSYAGLVLVATLCYAINVNMVSRYLKDVGSLHIASFAFSFLAIPSLLILYLTGYFQLPLHESSFLISSGAGIILGVMGTAVASIIFYILVKRAGILFPSMVTYAIPFVAIFWGLLDNEAITAGEIACLGIILAGVFLANT